MSYILGCKQFIWLLQKLLVNDFEWVEDTSQFNEDFMKSYNEEVI